MLPIKIKNAREAQGMSQRDLADKIKMSSGYIGQIESGKADPSLKTLEKIAGALNVDMAYLVEKEPSVLFDQYKEHFNLKEKEFLAQQKSKLWVTLSRELDEKGLTPEQVRKLLNIVMEMNEKETT